MRKILFVLGLIMVMVTCVSALEIHDAAASGDIERIRELLAADYNLINARDDAGATPLHSASYNGQTEVVKYLLREGANINALTFQQSCPLHGASFYNHPEIVRLLIAKGADLNLANRHGYVPMLSAAVAGNTEIVRNLIEAGADRNASVINGDLNALQVAASSGFGELVDYLLSEGFDIHLINKEGFGYLHMAAISDNAAIVKLGLERGLDPNLQNKSGTTPLHRVVTSLYWHEMTPEKTEMINSLITAGADVNRQNNMGDTPLRIAAETGKGELIKLLIDHGGNVNIANENGITPLMEAVCRGDGEIAQILIESGALTDTREVNYGMTPLHKAVLSGDTGLVRTLANHIDDPNIKDNSGKSPLYYAGKYGHKQIADMLITKGAKSDGMPRNFDVGKDLITAPEEGLARMWYLGHCSWGIRTKNHFLIFDYSPGQVRPTEPSLANGFIKPEELKNLNVEVFVTHSHGDHYDSVIYDWRSGINNISYIFGFRPDELPENQRNGFNGQPFEYIGQREIRTIDGMKIMTIASNDGGVGFMIDVDGLKIYHAGDHAGWENGDSIPYTSEIDYLADLTDDIDMAFINTTGCRFSRDTLALQNSVFYAIEKLSPHAMIPTHALGREYVYHNFAEKIRNAGYDIDVICADFKGDNFIFQRDRYKL